MRLVKVPSWRIPAAGGGARRGQGRKRVLPWWRTRPARMGLPALAGLVVIAALWAVVHSGWPGRVADRLAEATVAATVDAGLGVREVYVVGRRETSRQAILDALAISRGTPILAIDLEAARSRVAALPWVRGVSLERVLPDAIIVRIRERRPLALWQHNGAFAVVDSNGAVIDDHDVGQFGDLVVVVGDDAPGHAAEFIALLSRHPALQQRVRAGVRRGGRRWDLRLDNGIDIRLPEEGAAAALARLDDYQARHDVLGRNITVLDLRLPDQVIVRQAAPPEETPEQQGRDT